MAMTAADLLFDPVTHTSMMPNGRDVPHVTRILADTGVATDFDSLAALSPRLAARIAARCQLGSVVHQDCHAYDDDDLDWETVDARSLPFVHAWECCRYNLGLTPLAHARERRVFCAIHGYTGILDGIFRQTSSGKRLLLDLKLGDPEDSGCQFQTAAYEWAYLSEHPAESIDERWAVQLCPELRVPYRITDYTSRANSWQDFSLFLSFLATYRAQAVRRRGQYYA